MKSSCHSPEPDLIKFDRIYLKKKKHAVAERYTGHLFISDETYPNLKIIIRSNETTMVWFFVIAVAKV